MSHDEARLARALFALFLIQSQRAERELFGKLCRTYPDLRADLEPLYRSWVQLRAMLEESGRSGRSCES